MIAESELTGVSCGDDIPLDIQLTVEWKGMDDGAKGEDSGASTMFVTFGVMAIVFSLQSSVIDYGYIYLFLI
eukprot:TRINITY_DN15712_c0_g1_i1.p1 TRINITY_DN15712_c0_g1~~TRINITY_DN15712_c0_g1_i1.p1  ORF type:complete len:72 (+),score=15.89 TRINITY_DN15712_c0_g1_i1:67-282(+)